MTEPLIAYSLSNFREIIMGCLEASGARAMAEIGSEYGAFTEELCEFAARAGGKLVSIDPAPQPTAIAFHERYGASPHFEFLKKTSLEAIGSLGAIDVYIVDGDHNYYTVRQELEAIHAQQKREGRPLLVFEHDVGWPCARRDMYYAPERIPERSRKPYSNQGGVSFDKPGLVPGGFGDVPSVAFALEEGGKQNGVRTAIEDFMAEHPELRFEFVPGFFGLGVVYSREAPWSEKIAEILRPFADNVLLAKMEQNRSRLFSRVLELEHQSASQGAPGGYLQGPNMLEVFLAPDQPNFDLLYRTRLASRLRDEEELAAQNVHQFSLPGFCVVCNRMSAFATDRMFSSVDVAGRVHPAWRERQVCRCGFNCRQRSSYHVLTHLPGLTRQSDLYCTERGALFAHVRSAFPRAVNVEAVRGAPAEGQGASARARIGFADASLDCIFAPDLLEHVPDVRATLREMARCLRPFGWLLLTPNLHFDRAASVVRATEDDKGAVTHLLPAVHRPDSVDGRPLLAYHDIGWDLLATLRECGFQSAEIVAFTAPHYGYVGMQYVILAGRGPATAPSANKEIRQGEGRTDVAR
ncbi:MAG: class I SAM-dependent methyltransferase [Polyangiaceae bacterium]